MVGQVVSVQPVRLLQRGVGLVGIGLLRTHPGRFLERA